MPNSPDDAAERDDDGAAARPNVAQDAKAGAAPAQKAADRPPPARKARPPAPPLFRVVEVRRGTNGRLSAHGQIWHADLSLVRRFGRAVAANSLSQHVVVADSTGTVVETIPPPPPGAPMAGWGADWRAMPLPPAPPPRPARPAPPKRVVPGASAAPPAVPVPAGVTPPAAPPAASPAVPPLPVQPHEVPAEQSPMDITLSGDALPRPT